MANTRAANTQAANTPDVTAAGGLTANNLVNGIPVLGNPSVTQTHILTANGLTAKPILGNASITQTQVLSANGLVIGTPILGKPTLASGATALTALNLTNGIPILGKPDIGPLPTTVFRGGPVWWKGWPFDEEEESKPDVVNEIVEVPEEPHQTPTEDVVIARAKTIGVRLTPIQYDQVISRTLENMRDELKAMKREGRSMREAQERVEREIRKRARRLKEDEEMLLLS